MKILVQLPWQEEPVGMTAKDLKLEAVRFKAIGDIASHPAGSRPFQATFSDGSDGVSVVQDSTGTRLHYVTGNQRGLDIGDPIDCPPVNSKRWIKAAANMRRLAKLDSIEGLEELSNDPLEWKIPTKKRGPSKNSQEIAAMQVR